MTPPHIIDQIKKSTDLIALAQEYGAKLIRGVCLTRLKTPSDGAQEMALRFFGGRLG